MKSEKSSSSKSTGTGKTKKTPAQAATATPGTKKPRVKKPTTLEIPAILLEGDQPPAAAPSGPGQRYALGPTPPPAHTPTTDDLGELPEAYGTKKLLLTARDPHWLYAHWDLTGEQQRGYNARSSDGHLILRIYENTVESQPTSVVHVHPESRNWFVPVEHAGTKYIAELGYHQKNGKWTSISISTATLTPPDALSDDTSVRFATIPVDIPFEQLIQAVKSAVRENVPLAEAILQLRAMGHENLPAPQEISSRRWTPAQEEALARIVTVDKVRRVWMGSLEITELIRRQLLQEVSSLGAAQFSIPTSPVGGISSFSSLSSPFGGMERRKGFWFNVNAELIIYGATEPDAEVTIGGRQIKLRQDGTFSYRFILPDGEYDLPAIATSADKDDSRSAQLEFSRRTNYRGDVGAHPQDSNLKTPHAANVA